MANNPNLTQVELPNGVTYDLQDANKSGIYTVIGTQTSSTGSWTGTLHGVSSLYTGLTIAYYLPYNGEGSVTLNLTLDDGSTTGAISCYSGANNKMLEACGAGKVYVLTYFAAGDISISGTATTDNRWICDGIEEIVQSVSLPTSVASFNTDMVGVNLPALSVAITAKQSGSGDPYPAGGSAQKWDEEWIIANISGIDGTVQTGDNICSKNFIPVVPNSEYRIMSPNNQGTGSRQYVIYFYGNNKDFISYVSILNQSQTFIIPNNCYYVKFRNNLVSTTYNHDIAINYPSSVTTYSPYSNIRPIIGVSECNVCNTPMPVTQLWNIDSSFNGVVNFNQLIETKTAQTYQVTGLTITFDGNGKVTVEGKATSNTQIPITSNYPTYYVGHRYLIMGCPSGGSNSTYSLRYNSNGFGETGSGAILTAVSSGAASNAILVSSNYPAISITNGTTLNKTFEPIIIDLTQMFGSTIADYIHSLERATAGAGVAFFRSIYPNDYYAYDTGTDEMVGSREGNTYTIQLGDTYYGGSLDVTTGVLTVTHKRVDLGSLPFLYYDASQTFRATISDAELADFAGQSTAMCEIYAKTTAYTNVPDGSFIMASRWFAITPLIVIKDTNYTDKDTFKNAVSGYYLRYELATPITVQLTPTQVEQLLGTNNVWADTGNIIDIKYISGTCLAHTIQAIAEATASSTPSSGVRSVTINDKSIRVDTNGTTTDLTVPYSEKAAGILVATMVDASCDLALGKYVATVDGPSTPYAGMTILLKNTKGLTTLHGSMAYLQLNDSAETNGIITSENTALTDFSANSFAMNGTYILVYDGSHWVIQGTTGYQLFCPNSSDNDYPLLFKNDTEDSYSTNLASFGGLTYNPSTGDLTTPGDVVYNETTSLTYELSPAETATPGKVCSFSDAAEGVPLNDLQVSIEPKQASGTPWIDSTVLHKTPYLFTDVHSTASRIGNHIYDKLVGGTVTFNQLFNINGTIGKNNGAVDVTNNVLTFTTTYKSTYQYINQTIAFPQNHKFLISVDITLSQNETVAFGDGSTIFNATAVSANTKTRINRVFNYPNARASFYLYPARNAGLDIDGTMVAENFLVIDLTQMFGSTIADYIYSLEQATAGAGVAWFRKYFPKAYYAYNAGTLMSVQTSKHITVGFNQWDEEWEVGIINWNGTNMSSTEKIRSKNYIPCLPSTTYYAKTPKSLQLFYYDKDKNFISYEQYSKQNATFTTPSNAYYMRFYVYGNGYGTTYNHDICINLHWDGERDGEYESYVKHEYPLDSSLELRGIPKLDSSNNLYYDGDEYESDGTVTRNKFVYTFTGDETIGVGSTIYIKSDACDGFINLNNMKTLSYNTKDTENNARCSRFTPASVAIWNTVGYPNCFVVNGKQLHLNIANSLLGITDYTQETTTTIKEKIKAYLKSQYDNGTPITLVLPLETPTTEEADPYTNPQVVNDFGTEEYIDNRTIPIPVGHETYQANISDIIGCDTVNIHNTNSNVAPLFSVDSSFNGVVNFNQLVDKSKLISTTQENYTAVPNNDGSMTINIINSIASDATILLTVNTGTSYVRVPNGHKFLFSLDTENPNILFKNAYNGMNYTKPNGIRQADSNPILMSVILKTALSVGTYKIIPQIIDLTQMFGSTIADYIYSLEQSTSGAGVALFKSIYPEDYYAYDTGTTEIVGSRNGDDYSISLGDTYYGCTLDATTGVLTVDSIKTLLKDLPNRWKKLQSVTGAFYIARSLLPYAIDYYNRNNTKSNVYNYSQSGTQPNYSMRISDALYIVDDRWADVTEWQDYIDSNDIYIVYPLATPITVQLTKTQIRTLLRNNNIFANCGPILECTYYKNTNIVDAINDISNNNALALIDDDSISKYKTWSSDKITSEISSIIDDSAASSTKTYSSNKIESLPTTQTINSLETTDKTVVGGINEVNANLNSLIPVVETATPGAVCSFSDGADGLPLCNLKVAITAQQSGSGDPYPAGGGKNLVPMTLSNLKSINTTGSWSGDVYTINQLAYTIQTDIGGNVIGIKGHGTVSGGSAILRLGTFHLNTTSYTINGLTHTGSNSTFRIILTSANYATARATVTSINDTTYNADSDDFGMQIVVSNGATLSNEMFYPMMRLASISDNTFAPYSNIRPISGVSECNVVRCGKNVFDKSKERLAFVTSMQTALSNFKQYGKYATGYCNNTSGTMSNNGSYTTCFVPCKPNTTYSLKCYTSSFFTSVHTLDENGNSLSKSSNWVITYTVTTENNAKFLAFAYSGTEGATVEEASTPSAEYIPYTGNTYTIQFGDTYYGGVLNVTTGLLTVTKIYEQIPPQKLGISVSTITYVSGNMKSGNALAGICDTFNTVNSSGSYGVRFGANNSTIYFYKLMDNISAITDLATAKQWFTEHPVHVCYELATPITVQLTPTQVKSLLNVNNIWTDTGDITECKYFKTGCEPIARLIEVYVRGGYMGGTLVVPGE